MAKSKMLKFVGCAALAGVSYAVGRVIGTCWGIGYTCVQYKTNPEHAAETTDEAFAVVKEYMPKQYGALLKEYPELEEPETPDIQVTNQPED